MAGKQKRTNKQIREDGSQFIMETDTWKVYEVFTFEAIKLFGKGTTWCLTWENGEDWDLYSKTGRIVVFIKKDGDISDRFYKVFGWFKINFFCNGASVVSVKFVEGCNVGS